MTNETTASQSILMAYVATDLDGHADVGLTIESAKRRAGPGCDTIIALHDISTQFVELEGKRVCAPGDVLASPPKSIGDDVMRIRDEVDWENGFVQLLEGYKHATDHGICSRESVQAQIIAYVRSPASAAQASATIQAAPPMSEVFGNILKIQRAEAEAAPSDPYMRGLYNGMSMMCANIDGDLNWSPLAATIQEPVMVAEPMGRDGRMSDELRQIISGMSVSVDVSTGDDDAGNRYFGTINEVMDGYHGEKHGVVLLIQDPEPNFDRAALMVADPAGVAACTCPSGDGSLRWPCPQHPPELDPVVEANRALLHARSQLGIKKYGGTLDTMRHPRRALLQHALEEALDLSNYLQADIQAIDREAATVKAVPSEALDAAVKACEQVQARVIESNGGEAHNDDWSTMDEGIYAGAGYCIGQINALRAAAPLAGKTGGGE